MNKFKILITMLMICFLFGCDGQWKDQFVVKGKFIIDKNGQNSVNIILEDFSINTACDINNKLSSNVIKSITNDTTILVKVVRNFNNSGIIPMSESYEYKIYFYYNNVLINRTTLKNNEQVFYAMYRYDRISFYDKYQINYLDEKGEEYFLNFNSDIEETNGKLKSCNHCRCCKKRIKNKNIIDKEIDYSKIEKE